MAKPEASDSMQMGSKGSKCLRSGAVVKAVRRFKKEVLASGVKVNGTPLNFPWVPPYSISVSPPTILEKPMINRL